MKPAINGLKARLGCLEAVSLFADIGASPALSALAAAMEEGRFAKGATILREGENGSDVYFLVAGRASVQKKTAAGDTFPVASLDASIHPFFGEAALLDEDPRSASIIAESDCHCLVLSRAAFERFCRDWPAEALAVLRRVAQVVMARMRRANDDFVLLYHALVKEVRGR